VDGKQNSVAAHIDTPRFLLRDFEQTDLAAFLSSRSAPADAPRRSSTRATLRGLSGKIGSMALPFRVGERGAWFKLLFGALNQAGTTGSTPGAKVRFTPRTGHASRAV
jgi:hypothetical protein